jgi:hypothetical protein
MSLSLALEQRSNIPLLTRNLHRVAFYKHSLPNGTKIAGRAGCRPSQILITHSKGVSCAAVLRLKTLAARDT